MLSGIATLKEMSVSNAFIVGIPDGHGDFIEWVAPFLFVHTRGVSFIDIGWGVDLSLGPPKVHLVRGKIKEGYPWRVGHHELRVLYPHHDLYRDFIAYDREASIVENVSRDHAREEVIRHNAIKRLGRILA